MKWYRKALIGLCSLVLLVAILNIGLNLWIKSQLPKIINKKNDSVYNITYKNLKVSLWDGDIQAYEIVIVPKAKHLNTINKIGIYAEIKSLKVDDFKIWSILFGDKIKAQSITIEQPKIILYTKNEKENIRESVVSSFDKIIAASDVFLHQCELKIVHTKTRKPILKAHNINLQLEGILITKQTLDNKIPFEFRDYAFSCDSLYFYPNEFYHLKTKKIKGSKTDVSVNHFEMIPEFSRREFVAKIPKEKDLYTLKCQSIKVRKMDWGFKKNDFFFHCNVIDLSQVAANIYRSKEPADDITKKYLYNKLLRDLTFDLKVDTLKVRNSILEYEEEKSFDLGSGKLSFNSFNLTANNISSGFKKKNLPDITIKINCRFMKSSPLEVNWRFNPMDTSDGFNINGTLTNFDTEKIVPFTKPYLNVTTKGIMDEIYFDFTGNDQKASGEFAVKYDDLKFTIYKNDDRKKKNKLLTFVANIFIKKDTKEKVKDTNVELERIPEKSFYNLLWRSILEGLKKILV